MKNQKIKKIISIALLVPLILIILSYSKYTRNNVKESCSIEVEKYVDDISNQDGSIFLNSYLDLNCDGFYIIGPYATSEYKHKMVGQRWYNYSSYPSYLINEILFHGDTTDETLQQLVFVKDKKIISVATIKRKDGDFVFLKEKYYDIDQLFTNTKNDHGDKEIVQRM